MQKSIDRTFEDEQGKLTCTTTQLPALQAFKLLAKLGKLMGPALGALKGVKLTQDKSKLVPALTTLLAGLDPDDSEALVVQILAGTIAIHGGKVVELKQAAIDSVFGGRLILLFQVMAFALEANFADFFRGLAPGGGEAPAPAESP